MNSPYENLVHLANNTATMTEAQAKVLDELEEKKFYIKMKGCEITAIALIALGIFATAWISFITGITAIGLSLIPLTILKYQIDRQTVLLSTIETASCEIDCIIDNIVADLKARREHKEITLIDAFNHHSLPIYHSFNIFLADSLVKDLTKEYDNQTLSFLKPIHATQCHEYVKVIPIAESILSRNSPSSMNPAKWSKLQRICFMYLYGDGAIKTFPAIRPIWSKAEPFVKLEMDANERWLAKSYFTTI
jgi:hypothetical protein